MGFAKGVAAVTHHPLSTHLTSTEWLRSNETKHLSHALLELYSPTGGAFSQRLTNALASLFPEIRCTIERIAPQPENAALWRILEECKHCVIRLSDHPALKKEVRKTLTLLKMEGQAALILRRHSPCAAALLSFPHPLDDPTLARLEFLAPHVEQAYAQACPGEAEGHALHHGLTRRENEVLHWMREGKRDTEIAVILAISPRTVHHHVARILGKLGVETRTAAVRTLSAE